MNQNELNSDIMQDNKSQSIKDKENTLRWNNSNPCHPCIRCCQGQLIKVTEEDIKRWKLEQRYDILLSMETWTDSIPFLIQKKDRDECIFLTEKGCSIHSTRPEICVKFPASYTHAREMDCKLADILKEHKA
jgi:Fe-S-cluster containining protein